MGRGDRSTAPIHTSRFRINTTLRDVQADGLPVYAIPSEGVTGAGFLVSKIINSGMSVKTYFLKR